MPPKTSKTTLPPRRQQRSTAQDSVTPTSRDPHSPHESIPMNCVNYQNAMSEGASFVVKDVGPTIALANPANSGPALPDISNLVRIPPNSGSVRPESHNFSGEAEPERSREKKILKRRVVRVVKKIVRRKLLKMGIKQKAEYFASENSASTDVEKAGSANNATETENVNLVVAQDTFLESMEVEKADSAIDERITSEVVPLDKSMGVIEVKEQTENNSNTMNQGLVVLSGELEALKRRKRRKTEIFVGGLDRDTKESDIRKVFEEIGEIMEVRLAMNHKTGQNKGFAFVKYSSADEATRALSKYSKVEICGKECGVKPVEGNDTLHLGNINKTWKNNDIIKLLKKAGIDKIDEVTVVPDANKTERNRGFAFVEFETYKDAQDAFLKIQTKDVFKSHPQIKVSWAQPRIEPDEEVLLKVKTVYAENLPSSWGEEEVKMFFKRFGEIESVSLAKILPSARRKDFAFVNYTTREAALECIEAFSKKQIHDDGSKVTIKVSLSTSSKKSKQPKHSSSSTSKDLPKEKRKATHSIAKPREPKIMRTYNTNIRDEITAEREYSTTNAEIVYLLRQQALSQQALRQQALRQQTPQLGYSTLSHLSPYRSLSVHDPIPSLDLRRYSQFPVGRSYPVQSPSSIHYGIDYASSSSSSYNHQVLRYVPSAVSLSGQANLPSQSQVRQQGYYYDNSSVHHQY